MGPGLGQQFISTLTAFIGIKMAQNPHWPSRYIQETVKWAHKTHQMHSGFTEWDTRLPTILSCLFWGQQIVHIGGKVAKEDDCPTC